MKKTLTFIALSITLLSFCQQKEINWFNGTIENAMLKAEKLDAILFIYIYPENNALSKKVNKIYFTPLPAGSWDQKTAVIDVHNNFMVSIKFTAERARRELGDNYDLTNPIFLWMNSINKKPIKGEIFDVKKELDLIELSETILKEQYEKTGKSHPAYEFENIKKIIKTEACKTLFCRYDIVHRIFLKMPEHQKEIMYEELSNYPGSLDSIELQWLMQQNEFLEADNEDKMDIFYNALTYSFGKSIPNRDSISDKEAFEAFGRYATDKLIEPLGKYAKDFKQYLIEEEEGKGFRNNE